jgi:hypothetical protein
VPSPTFAAVSVQTGPASQVSAPTWHGFAGTHAPGTQATHAPAEHTSPAPHGVPFPTSPFSVHTGWPVSQATVPVRQMFAGEHACPALQVTHAPSLQTRSAPQPVPFGSFRSVSVQTGPAEHDSEPT